MTDAWWKTAVIYQVYPRSFQDSNGDGVGDLPGIIRRLPYLAELGVGAIWLSPVFPSPMKDFGYDICDYTGIDALFGTMVDFDALLAAVRANGLKLILDFVPNHTSDHGCTVSPICRHRANALARGRDRDRSQCTGRRRSSVARLCNWAPRSQQV
jgi:1,4-alpha-glucan branching enzyme